ncbi:hypothetical protein [Sphingobacterium lumbrici]|uniref:hypothetical protein n=1 Tax=Sphingobacterium lumbrici TaxID=2559600 RepID=UPI001128FFE9|nr:hypothetical protein [Sphingobacterium lumbrici]
MEKYFQQLIEQAVRTNDLLEKQAQVIENQKIVLKRQQETLQLIALRMERMEEIQQLMADILDRDLLSLLDQPLLLKPQVMAKLDIADSTYRAYVDEGKLQPMWLGKIDYYFPRDLNKILLASKGKRRS